MSDETILATIKSKYSSLDATTKRLVTGSWTDFEKWVMSIIAIVIGSAAWDRIKKWWSGT